MPRHATKTSFKPGRIRPREEIERSIATIREKYGYWPASAALAGKKQSKESIKKRAETRRANSIGNRRIQNGYWVVMTISGVRYEHRIIMESIIGRPLLSRENIHHINGNKLDNRPENLRIIDPREHPREHLALPAGKWAKNFDACTFCGLTSRKHSGKGLCTRCYQL